MAERVRMWLDVDGRPCAVTVYGPSSGGSSTVGVLLVPSTAHEERTMSTGLHVLAGLLADRGALTLVVDLGASGQSPGSLDETDLVSFWQQQVRAGVEELRRRGVGAVVAVGVRLGALVATTSLDAVDLDALVLWAPTLNGRRFGRELRLLADLKADGAAAPEGSSDALEIAGFAIPPSLLVQLRALDCSRTRLGHRRVLVVDDPQAAPLDTKAFGDLAAPIERLEAPGTAAWLYRTSDGSDVPVEDFRHLVTWIVNGASPAEPGAGVPADAAAAVGVPVCERDGVRESFVDVGPLRLAAVLTEPVDVAPQPVSVLLLESVGPGGSFVQLGRALARAGHTSMRVDMSSFGASPCRPGQHWNAHYSAPCEIDAADALAELRRRGHHDVAVVGFCSSAWAALRVRAQDGVRTVVPVNLQSYINASKIVVLNRQPATVIGRWFADRSPVKNRLQIVHNRVVRMLPWDADPLRWITRLAAAGVRVRLLFDAEDEGLVYLRRRRWLGAPSRRPAGVELEQFAGLGHSLEHVGPRAVLLQRIVSLLGESG